MLKFHVCVYSKKDGPSRYNYNKIDGGLLKKSTIVYVRIAKILMLI